MCKSASEGGQRCAAHTRAKFNALDRSDAGWDHAAAEYASTDEGMAHLNAAAAVCGLDGDFDEEAHIKGLVAKGRSIKAANKEAGSVLSAMNIDTPPDDDDDDDDDEEEHCRTEDCEGDLDDGEGYDGYCGDCADQIQAKVYDEDEHGPPVGRYNFEADADTSAEQRSKQPGAGNYIVKYDEDLNTYVVVLDPDAPVQPPQQAAISPEPTQRA